MTRQNRVGNLMSKRSRRQVKAEQSKSNQTLQVLRNSPQEEKLGRISDANPFAKKKMGNQHAD